MDNQQHLLHCALELFSQREYAAAGFQDKINEKSRFLMSGCFSLLQP